jgi:hypothetical protein
MAGYDVQVADPLAAFLKGYQGMQEIGMNKSREDRAQQLHGMSMQQGQQGLEAGAVGIAGQRQAQEYNAQMQPYAVAGAQQQQEAQAAATEKAARAQEYQAEFGRLASKPGGASFEEMQAFHEKYPEYVTVTQQNLSTLSDGQRKAAASTLGQGIVAMKAGNIDVARKVITDYATAAENAGDAAGAASARAGLELLKGGDQASIDRAVTVLGNSLMVIDPDAARSALGQTSGASVQSQEAIGPFVLRLTMRDGTTVLQDTRTGQPIAADAAQSAIDESLAAEREQRGGIKAEERTAVLGADISMGGEVEATKQLASAQVEFAKSAIEGSNTVLKNINTLDEAIAAIDAGGKAGSVQKYLPNVSQASATLGNAMDRLGLDVIGSVTFGALSEGELRLAMDTAVPRNLDEGPLRAWLVEKREAQEKVRAALTEQARFLSNPKNTLEMWVDKVGGNGGTPAPAAAAPAAPAPAVAAPAASAPSYASKYGGGN